MGKRTPSGLKFFFDACFPLTLARALGELDIENDYLHLFDKLPRNTPDTQWIPTLSRELIVVSGDGRILRNPIERDVWMASQLRGFFLNDTFPNKSLWEQTKFVVDRWEKVLRIAARCKAGETFRLPWGSGLKLDPWEPRRR